MKYLLHRLTALLLAVLLLCSAVGLSALAAQDGPDPACVLGTDPTDMLSAGGRRVRAGERQLYIDEADGSVYALAKPRELVLEGPVAKLNYADGMLYYAREREEGCFDLCCFDLEAGTELVLLAGFSGQVGQLWLVDNTYLDFSCGNAVWQFELATGAYRLILYVDQLWSFVPTGCGLVYAVGSLFDYTLYAGGQLLAEHVSDYTLRFGQADCLVVYESEGAPLQADLAAAFAGTAVPVAYRGGEYDYTALSSEGEMSPEEAQLAAEAEREQAEEELEAYLEQAGEPSVHFDLPEGDAEDPQDPPDPDPADPTEPTEPAEPEPTEPEPTEPAPTEPAPAEPEPTEPVPTEPEPTEPAPTEPAPTEPAPTEPAPTEPAPTEPAPTEPAPTEPAPVEPEKPAEPAKPDEPAEPDKPAPGETPNPEPGDAETPVAVIETPPVPTPVFVDGVLRKPVSNGQKNIVKRARQMLNIKWTPVKGVGGWGYYDSGYSLSIYYHAGVTYTGLPYGQAMSYVPWNTSYSGFISAVNNPNSKLYTERCSYSRGSQYYGTDCSGFASWAWQTGSRKVCSTMISWSHTYAVGRSYTLIEVGDALIGSGHAILITDVTYNSDGSIYSIETSESNPTIDYNGCCYSKRFTGQAALESFNSSYLSSRYTIYRSDARDTVSYTHDCKVPLEGDVCAICGVGMEPQPDPTVRVNRGVDLSTWNGDVDWMVLSGQIDFAILRVGYTGNGSSFALAKDARFDANAAGCEAYNVPYGIYWYAGAKTQEQAIQEAEAVIEYLGLMSGSGHIPRLPVFYDVEENNNILKLTDTELRTVITAFCSTIENFGLKAGVYASRSIWASRMTNNSTYGQWARWVAQWESSSMTAPAGGHVWQYACDGKVPGVNGNVDLDYWLGEVGSTAHPCSAVVEAPGCLETGTLNCSCITSSCGETFKYEIPALGHNYVNGYCTRCGINQDVFERFEDVEPNKWYSDALVWAVENGITAGTSDNTFSPKQTCPREQAVTFLWKASGSPEATETECPFEGVTEDRYYYNAILWAVENGVTSGVSETSFGVGWNCTRAQVVAFLYAAAGRPEVADAENPFVDVNADDYYYNAVLWAVQNGITSGISETEFGPKLPCNRAQIVTFLYGAQKAK